MKSGVALKRFGVVLASSALASALLLGKAIWCAVLTPGSCPNPKPGLATLAFAFSIGSWLTVFPLALFLGRHVPKLLAGIVVPFVASAVWALFDTPTVERMGFVYSFSNIARQVLLPWFVGSIPATSLWPNKPMHATCETHARDGRRWANERRSK